MDLFSYSISIHYVICKLLISIFRRLISHLGVDNLVFISEVLAFAVIRLRGDIVKSFWLFELLRFAMFVSFGRVSVRLENASPILLDPSHFFTVLFGPFLLIVSSHLKYHARSDREKHLILLHYWS